MSVQWSFSGSLHRSVSAAKPAPPWLSALCSLLSALSRVRVNRRRTISALLFAALCVAAMAGACDDASGRAPEATPAPAVALDAGLPVVMSVRVVCRLASDTPSAVAAQITGADGSQSVVAGGRSYWFFGDTVRKTGDLQDVIPAALATTDDVDARDCLDLRFKTTDGVAQPMFPRLDETTAWPDGVLALDDGSIVFYMVKAYRQSPFAWHVGSVGLGRIPAGSVDGVRAVETIWDERSGFGKRVVGVRSPVRIGEDVIAYIHTGDDRNYVTKAPLARMAEFGAYTYWDGAAWSPDPAKARPMWRTEETGLPADNGVQVSYDERIGKWIALYNREMATVEVRTADEPWGPWSAPLRWFDCRPLVQEHYPYCYTGELHRQLTRDGGETLYMTVSSQQPYDVTLLELRMATAIHEWRGDGGRRYAATTPGAGYQDAGVAFYASATPVQGLSPVYETTDGDGYDYALDAPSAGAVPVFFAYSTQPSGAVAGVAVRRGDGGALVAGGSGETRFFVPCPVAEC